MSLRDEIALTINDYGDGLPGNLAREAADAILAKLRPAPLVWQRNGSHWAGGYGYVVRKFGGEYVMTFRNRFDQKFDTLEDAKAAAEAHHIAAWRKAGGLDT